MAEISNQLSVNNQGINPSNLANARRADEDTEATNRTAENEPGRNRTAASGESASSSAAHQDRVSVASSGRTETPGAVEDRVLRNAGGAAANSSGDSQPSASPSTANASSTQPGLRGQVEETAASDPRSLSDSIRNAERGTAPTVDSSNESAVESEAAAATQPDRSVQALVEDAKGESGSGLIAGVNTNPAFETPSQRLEPPASVAAEGSEIKPARPNPEDENLRDSVETQIQNRELRDEQATARRESVEEQNDRGQNINRLI
ncbi:MAG: hypothetical protein ACE5ER_10355 [Nitrospinaceae bacterium]